MKKIILVSLIISTCMACTACGTSNLITDNKIQQWYDDKNVVDYYIREDQDSAIVLCKEKNGDYYLEDVDKDGMRVLLDYFSIEPKLIHGNGLSEDVVRVIGVVKSSSLDASLFNYPSQNTYFRLANGEYYTVHQDYWPAIDTVCFCGNRENDDKCLLNVYTVGNSLVLEFAENENKNVPEPNSSIPYIQCDFDSKSNTGQILIYGTLTNLTDETLASESLYAISNFNISNENNAISVTFRIKSWADYYTLKAETVGDVSIVIIQFAKDPLII